MSSITTASEGSEGTSAKKLPTTGSAWISQRMTERGQYFQFITSKSSFFVPLSPITQAGFYDHSGASTGLRFRPKVQSVCSTSGKMPKFLR